MRIVSLNTYDIGGISYELCRAINKTTKHRAVSVVSKRPFTLKPFMYHKKNLVRQDVRNLTRNADVIHFNAYSELNKTYGIPPHIYRNKKMVFHIHGSRFRQNHENIKRRLDRYPRLKVLVSTPDLLIHAPKGAEWFPSPVPVERLRRTYRTRRNKVPVIYFSPTQSLRQSDWSILNNAATTLRKKGKKFKIKLARRVRYNANMTRKSKADIYFDEIRIFYGINAVEAAAFELAVIHGLSPYCRSYMEKKKIKWPFVKIPIRNRRELRKKLGQLIDDEEYRRRVGRNGYQYVKKMHSPKMCARAFLKIVKKMK